MNKYGFIKYKILRFKKPIITEGEFCEKIRTGKQKQLIKKIKQTGTNIYNLNINWDYISKQDNLRTCFIEYFQDFIDFDNLSENKYLTINKIRKFRHKLNWNILSRCYKFEIDELKEFSNLLNWQFIFFYQNLTNDVVKKHFTGYMWWLFSNDKIQNDIDIEYKNVNNMIIHKNIRNIPKNFTKTFNKKLNEYVRNREQLKQTLKEELIQLIDNFNSSGEIKRLKSIQINICEKNKIIQEEDVIETFEKCIQVEEQIERVNTYDNPFFLLENFNELIERSNTNSSIEDINIEDEVIEEGIMKKSSKNIVDNILCFLNEDEITIDLVLSLYNKIN